MATLQLRRQDNGSGTLNNPDYPIALFAPFLSDLVSGFPVCGWSYEFIVGGHAGMD
jgi:hypothetical protein